MVKDLQELFEFLGHDEIDRLVQLQDKKNVNPKNLEKVLDYISDVYCNEKDIEEANVTSDQMTKLVEDFFMCATLYLHVLNGVMEMSGRLMLTDGENCKFKLTAKGKESAEKIIKGLK